jgi:hypothetical protein
MNRYNYLFFLFLFLGSKTLKADWINLNIGINDNFNAVSFTGDRGILAGDKGIYYTTTGGNDAAAWKRFNIKKTNASDSALYNHCQFYSITYNMSDEYYICGWDSVDNKAVILYFDVPSLNYSFMYVGNIGTKLNGISYNYGKNHIYAVGDKGLVVWSDDLNSFQTVSSGTTQNLYSVDGYQDYFAIGGNGVFLDAKDVNNNLYFTIYNRPSSTIRDMINFGSDGILAVGGSFYSITKNGAVDSKMIYDFGPLQGKSIYSSFDGYYVGTSHGIFKADNSISFLELQPSSSSYNVNDVCLLDRASSIGYAACKNGVLLKTTDAGGITKPYASLNLKGVCNHSKLTLYGNPGTATTCEWHVNNLLVSQRCVEDYQFDSVGFYTIKYVVYNYLNIADTATQVIQVIDTPQVNLPVSVLDPILCKNQALTISINNTQTHVVYNLKRLKDNVLMASDTGTGGKIVLTTLPKDENAFYYVEVQSQLATCEARFPDTIKIKIEKTKADFNSSYINANRGEAVLFSQQCHTAQHYLWTFAPNANVAQSSSDKPSGIIFSQLGSTTAKLIAWSDNGCYDTIIKSGPNIIDEPVSDNLCWGFALNGNDANWMGYYIPDIAQQVLTKDGYLICGSHYKNFFTTRRGNALGLIDTGGCYIAKYSRNGTLKWVDYGATRGYNSSYRMFISAIVSDSKTGSIYGSSFSSSNETFFENDGDTVKLSGALQGFSNSIFKMNTTGHILWNATLGREAFVNKIKMDKSGELIAVGTFDREIPYSLNGKDTILFKGMIYGGNSFIIKLDTNGVVKWCTYFKNEHHNGGWGIHDFDIDTQGNILITGGVETKVVFHSANGTVRDSIQMPPNTDGSQLYNVKYDKNGVFSWWMSGIVNVAYPSILSNAIAVDDMGNSYVTGTNNCADSSYTFTIINGDKTTFTASVGAYFLLKINDVGKVIWCNGSKYVKAGGGFNLNIQNNELSVLGMCRSQTLSTWYGKMTSTDGKDLNFNLGPYDFFIARYNLNGAISSILSTGPNPDGALFSGDYSFSRDEAGNYFFAGNLQNSYNGPPYNIGNDKITTNGSDGFMFKLDKLGCGIFTDVKENTNLHEEEWSAYPNPVSEKAIISMKNVSAAYDLTIYNSVGSCVYSKHFTTTKCTLDKTDFGNGKAGIYFINIRSTDHLQNVTKKIIVTD